ncbi:MAG TPA: hypothetical protein VG433_02805 [Pirellulales bacterium]|nr:hypothetical protein [Pirellulales bacterium]
MSPQDSNSRGFLSLFNVYTVMLGVAFLAIVMGCVLLSMELGRYKWNIKAKGVAQASAPHGAVVWLDRAAPRLA